MSYSGRPRHCHNVPLLLDLFSANGAYSCFRRLRTAYSGSAIRVRRSADSTEQDIGFVGRSVDFASLASFCSGTSGFIKTWYDQSGNTRDLAMTTTANQPRIVNSGTIDLISTSAAMVYDGSNDLLTRADVFGLTGTSPACTIAGTYSLTNTS